MKLENFYYTEEYKNHWIKYGGLFDEKYFAEERENKINNEFIIKHKKYFGNIHNKYIIGYEREIFDFDEKFFIIIIKLILYFRLEFLFFII